MNKIALISVSDKSGVTAFARRLSQAGITIVSTGGTARILEESGIPVTPVSDLTGFPEILDGRVKTLHPYIHGALLARRDKPEHMEAISRLGIKSIDIVAVNLYPFAATIRKPGVTVEEAVENIDIGGPSMIRSAAKNFNAVTVIVDPADYNRVAEELETAGTTTEATRRELMVKAFAHTAAYDRLIAEYFSGKPETADHSAPELYELKLKRYQALRYGENPHQTAAFYIEASESNPGFRQLHGKELSYNNLLDSDACLQLISEFTEPCCCIVKHNNPCGVAVGDTPVSAFERALAADPVSAYGGIIGFNRPVTEETAMKMNALFAEAVIAPAFESGAIQTLTKKKNVRLLTIHFEDYRRHLSRTRLIRNAAEGYLIQQADAVPFDIRASINKIVTRRQPVPSELEALAFSWRVVKHVKSNAIVFSNAHQTLGIGAGQMARVDAVRLAMQKAAQTGLDLRGSVLASDAFFPFRDNVDLAAQAGVTAIIQPGGSVRDKEVIEAADAYNMAMIFTGIRHFKH